MIRGLSSRRRPAPLFSVLLLLLPLLLVGLMASTPAHAKGLSGLLIGLNGILTAPADPIRHVIAPPRDFDEVPAHQVSGRVLGIFSGTLLGAYRAVSGALDVALTPLWVVPTLSPDPSIKVVPGAR